MEDCIFCKIVEGKSPSYKILEDEEHLAFLDIYPIVKGQTLVITKKHFDSYQFNLPDDVYTKLFLFAKKVGKILEKALGAKRVFLVVEGMEVKHIHIKLYPVYKINSNVSPKIIDTLSKDIKENWYNGYIATLHGERASDEELKEISDKVKEYLMKQNI
ncbi:MAG: HIT family protein [Candidatus Aenigmarchaeota archaeon]|nr:HIT family protein [Candidatus Aenigmarchaeota archaeon]